MLTDAELTQLRASAQGEGRPQVVDLIDEVRQLRANHEGVDAEPVDASPSSDLPADAVPTGTPDPNAPDPAGTEPASAEEAPA